MKVQKNPLMLNPPGHQHIQVFVTVFQFFMADVGPKRPDARIKVL